MKGALSRRMIFIGVFCAIGIACVVAEMLALLPFLLEERRLAAGTPRVPGTVSFRGLGVICPGLLGWAGTWGYLASWLWLPTALWRVVRRKTVRRNVDWILPGAVALEVVTLQCVLRLTPLASEGYLLL